MLVSIGASALDNPLWIRGTAISPDGATLAFTYRGDIFTVPATGGRAHQLTSNSAYDSSPCWSPDGSKIAFRSDREGSDDIYIVDSKGGTARRLTTGSGSETPLAFLNDSTLLFQSSATAAKEVSVPPFMPMTYSLRIDRADARPALYLPLAMPSVDVRPDGTLIYQDKKGYENSLRKHERSSGTSDIWTYDGKDFRKLTSFNGHDLCPRWAEEEGVYYYISEKDGTLNVYRGFTDGRPDIQLTEFKEHPVRNLSAASNGTLAFTWDGEPYVMKPGAKPEKINVSIVTDDYDSDKVKAIRRSGASNMAVSPDGDEVAFVLRGDIYVTSTKYKTTKRITNTPGQERCLDFSADGRTLVYDSDRDGKWQIFTTTIVNPDEKKFAYATELKEELLYSGDNSAQQPLYSPDGKHVAFLDNRTAIMVIDTDTKKVNTALDGKFNYSYSDGDVPFEWSPDSKWLFASYIGTGGWNNQDIVLISRDGKTVVDLTESGYSDVNPRWALDGKALLYSSGKYGMKSQASWGNQSDIMLMVLDGDAWDDFNMTEEEAALKEKAEEDEKEKSDSKDDKNGKKKDKKKDKKSGKKQKAAEETISPDQFDLANRRYRTRRLTDMSNFIGEYYLSKKGDKLYYTASTADGSRALYKRDLKKGETEVLTKGVSGMLVPDRKGENLFVLSYNGMSKVELATGDKKNIEFEAFYDRKPSLEREYIYDHMLTQVREKFYDEKMHGVDWKKYGDHYRKFLPHIDNSRDFAELMSEILGELNASHTGASAYPDGPSMSTAQLGAVFDDNHKGAGLLVAEILPRGPLSKKAAGIEAGDIILAIDGDTIEAGSDYYPMLEGKAGKKVNLLVKKKNGTSKTTAVRPLSGGGLQQLLYQRWVEHNENVVDSISGGKVGYVHVRGMDDSSFRTVYDRLLGRYRNCEAVVVDTRYNGGGWLHNDIALLLGGKEYVRYTPRGHYIGSDPFSQWTKPSVMLVNESNYSDAHGTPYVYQTLGIGEVVGAPVPGTMTAVWWEGQIDPDIVFGIPQVTSIGVKEGHALENHQLNPDVLIYNNPGELIQGKDAQLEGAVRRLMEKLK